MDKLAGNIAAQMAASSHVSDEGQHVALQSKTGKEQKKLHRKRLLETGRVAVLAEWQRDGCKPWEAELTELPPRCGLDGGEPTDRGGGALFV